MKPFDLKAALAGEPVVTREGDEATQIHIFNITEGAYPIAAVIYGNIQLFDMQGRFWGRVEHDFDLFMKENTININGHEVPMPVREPLYSGQKYFLADTTVEHILDFKWSGTFTDRYWLGRGIIHLTMEAAQQHVDALISFTKRNP